MSRMHGSPTMQRCCCRKVFVGSQEGRYSFCFNRRSTRLLGELRLTSFASCCAFARVLKKLAYKGAQPAVALVVMKLAMPDLFELYAWRLEWQTDHSQAGCDFREVTGQRFGNGDDQVRLRHDHWRTGKVRRSEHDPAPYLPTCQVPFNDFLRATFGAYNGVIQLQVLLERELAGSQGMVRAGTRLAKVSENITCWKKLCFLRSGK